MLPSRFLLLFFISSTILAGVTEEISLSERRFQGIDTGGATMGASSRAGFLIVSSATEGLYFTRLTRTGAILDPIPRLLTLDGAGVSAAANESGYLVSWTTRDTSVIAFIDFEGRERWRRTLPPATSASCWYQTLTLANASTFLVVVQDCDFRYSAYVVDSNGALLSDAITLGHLETPAFSADPLGFVIVTRDADTLVARRLSRDGSLTEPNPIVESGGSISNVIAAWNGSSHFIAWTSFGRDIGTIFISPDLRKVAERVDVPNVGFLRDAATVREVGALLTDLGIVLVSVTGEVSARVSTPGSRLVGGDSLLILWDSFARIATLGDGKLDLGSPFMPVRGVASQDQPTLASGDMARLALWREARDPARGPFLLATRLAEDGTPIDPRGIVIAEDGTGAASAAFDGVNYLIVWDVGWGAAVRARFLSRDGQLSETFSLAVNAGVFASPSVAFDGEYFLVTWTARAPAPIRGCAYTDIYGARVARSGLVLDPGGFKVSSGQHAAEFADVASSGAGWLVTWSTSCSLSSHFSLNSVRTTRVSRSGNVAASFEIRPAMVDEFSLAMPSLATDLSKGLVVFRDFPRLLAAARIDSASSVERLTVVGRLSSDRPAVAWDGARFVIVWEENGDLAARAVPVAGPLRAAPFSVASAPTRERAPDATFWSEGRVAVVYTRVASEEQYGGAKRVFLRFVTRDEEEESPLRRRAARR